MGKDKSAEERGIHYKFNNLGARGFQHFNPILGEGERIPPPPHDFFDRSALKDSTKWGSWGITIKVIAIGRHLKRFWDQNFFWVRSGSS